MRRFDVFRNPNKASARDVPWLLILQSDLLDEFSTRVVAPLVPLESIKFPATRLNPSFSIEGRTAVMLTQQVGAVTKGVLKQRVVSLESSRTMIIGAVDFLLGGV